MTIELKQISDLYNSNYSRRFPSGLAGEEINGIDLVMLAADIMGIVDRFLGRRHNLGKLDEKWHTILKELETEVKVVCREIPESGKEFFHELQLLTEWTLIYLENNSNEISSSR